ncbi:2-keto-4-pentenoate hydratase [Granulicella sibirica]|uniref:2-keto-4-pentenoate hydratase n=1 Tax=Granulicella sibirica TaxID=2479048 RepID=A0A4V1L5K1_9BACT|nr:fumarylacetoacetate hydrolase family protein [Granulicella sibirica]RXH56044.1 2-keto-4-pentenoate hydratase [Granulicella sibirica]
MIEPTGPREAQLIETSNILLDARRTGVLIDDLPVELRPTTMDEVYFVQGLIAQAYTTPEDGIGGWKIGAPNPEATPAYAPLPKVWIAPSGALLSGSQWRYRGLEAEIAFLLGADLPPRSDTPYTREEVLAAVASCHPVIEVLESGLLDPMKADRMSMLADLQMHGGLVYGAPVPEWQSIDWTQETVALAVDGSIRVERTGSNTSGDFVKLLPWLANEGAIRTRGLYAGQWITTGSWTGNTLAMGQSSVDVRFHTAGRVTLRYSVED